MKDKRKFEVTTKFETIYTNILSWDNWVFDENFIEFNQAGNLLILPKDQILAIKETFIPEK